MELWQMATWRMAKLADVDSHAFVRSEAACKNFNSSNRTFVGNLILDVFYFFRFFNFYFTVLVIFQLIKTISAIYQYLYLSYKSLWSGNQMLKCIKQKKNTKTKEPLLIWFDAVYSTILYKCIGISYIHNSTLIHLQLESSVCVVNAALAIPFSTETAWKMDKMMTLREQFLAPPAPIYQ